MRWKKQEFTFYSESIKESITKEKELLPIQVRISQTRRIYLNEDTHVNQKNSQNLIYYKIDFYMKSQLPRNDFLKQTVRFMN